jgi:hypothetical protein
MNAAGGAGGAALCAADGARPATVAVGTQHLGLLFDGPHVWAAVSDNDSVERVESVERSVPVQPPSD